MKHTIKTLAICIVGSLLITGCEDNDVAADLPGGEKTSGKIMLASKNTTSAITRAVADDGKFPNEGRIGVVGALYNETAIDWESYPDLTNVPADTISLTAGKYLFQWETQKYWPFDNTKLVFMAYSPYLDGSELNLRLSDDKTQMSIGLYEDMPDIMYASGNVTAATTPYDKLSGEVNLGQFRHAMSKLAVEVVPFDNTMSASIVASHLRVITSRRGANLNLLLGDEGMQVAPLATQPFQYSLIETPTPFKTTPISETVLLFPETEDDIYISVGLVDTNTGSSIDQTFQVSSFLNMTNSGEPLTLERGKMTTLRIVVAAVPVRQPNEQIILKGTLSEWNQKGNFGISIK